MTAAPENNWAKVGATFILADALADSVFKAAKVEVYEKAAPVFAEDLHTLTAAHPLARTFSATTSTCRCSTAST